MKSLQQLAILILNMALCAAASAQNNTGAYPNRPVTIIVANVPGGLTDVGTRLYAQKLTESLGKPFVVEYKPGAAGVIGASYVAKALPDGYTLLVATTSFPVVPAFRDDLPYDPIKDFSPISLMNKGATVLIASPAFPATNLKEYIAYAKSNPGKISIATSGNGSIQHLTGAWLHSTTNTEATFVHYKGSNAAIPDLIAGRINAYATNLFAALPYIRSGKARPLATLSLERSALLPDLRTAAEQGLDSFEMPSWVGLISTGGTPDAVVARLGSELSKVAKQPDVIKRMEAEGTTMVGSSPAQFNKVISTEVLRWRTLVKSMGITLD